MKGGKGGGGLGDISEIVEYIYQEANIGGGAQGYGSWWIRKGNIPDLSNDVSGYKGVHIFWIHGNYFILNARVNKSNSDKYQLTAL